MKWCCIRFLSQDIFDSISDYLITGKQLYGRVLTVTAFNYQIMGYPLSIENEKVSGVASSVPSILLLLVRFNQLWASDKGTGYSVV